MGKRARCEHFRRSVVCSLQRPNLILREHCRKKVTDLFITPKIKSNFMSIFWTIPMLYIEIVQFEKYSTDYCQNDGL